MMWMMRRTAVIVTILAVSCAGVVLIVRANAAPDRLAALGFGVCEGKPCFRGIKPGMAWENVLAQHSNNASIDRSQLSFVVALEGNPVFIEVQASSDQRLVEWVIVRHTWADHLPLNIGEVTARYGPPCRVMGYTGLTSSRIGRAEIALVYPRVMLSAYVDHAEYRGTGFQPETLLQNMVMPPAGADTCKIFDNYIPRPLAWRGFASADFYRAEAQRITGSVP